MMLIVSRKRRPTQIFTAVVCSWCEFKSGGSCVPSPVGGRVEVVGGAALHLSILGLLTPAAVENDAASASSSSPDGGPPHSSPSPTCTTTGTMYSPAALTQHRSQSKNRNSQTNNVNNVDSDSPFVVVRVHGHVARTPNFPLSNHSSHLVSNSNHYVRIPLPHDDPDLLISLEVWQTKSGRPNRLASVSVPLATLPVGPGEPSSFSEASSSGSLLRRRFFAKDLDAIQKRGICQESLQICSIVLDAYIQQPTCNIFRPLRRERVRRGGEQRLQELLPHKKTGDMAEVDRIKRFLKRAEALMRRGKGKSDGLKELEQWESGRETLLGRRLCSANYLDGRGRC